MMVSSHRERTDMTGGSTADRQIDNERAIVTRWTLPPGGTTGPHRHGYDYVVVPITDGNLRFTQPDGVVGTAALAAGVAYARQAGIEHDVANPGDETVIFVEVEIK
jgi:quercetin dioxygenase-like cupin family protein